MRLRSLMFLAGLMLLVSAVSTVPAVRAKDEKLKPEQLIEKHLASIGSPEALKAVKTRIVQGTTHVVFRVGGDANMDGQGTILSDGESLRVGFKFPALQYPGEQLASDGNKIGVAKINPARRSDLGEWIFENEEMLREGLLFGTLTTAWPLLGQRDTQPKLELNGPKKIDGESVYELKYQPKHRNGNINTFLYFDATTFRHVRSEFRADNLPLRGAGGVGGGGGRGGRGGGGGGDNSETTRITIIERFDDFKAEDGLTLPHSYKLDFTIDTPTGGFVGTWTFTANQFAHNQQIDHQLFSIN